MYCPNDACPDFAFHGIRGEYREGIATCPRCGGALLPGSAPAPPAGPDDAEPTDGLAVVACLPSEHEANLAVSFLQSQGITALVSADDCGRTDPVLGRATGGVRVLVPLRRMFVALHMLRRAGVDNDCLDAYPFRTEGE